MVFLQFAVEKITGKKLNNYMQEVVFDPLGMKHSSYVWNSASEADVAVGHKTSGAAVDLSKAAQANAASSLQTTAEEYAVFLQAVLEGKGLQPATLKEMETLQIAVDTGCINCLDNTRPAKPSSEISWGLGFGIEKSAEGESLWHWGDSGVFKSFFTLRLEAKSAVVYLTNSENGLAIAEQIVAETIGGRDPALEWLNSAK
jgi:CubicO group peptidase (beta-lactamase class C family)